MADKSQTTDELYVASGLLHEMRDWILHEYSLPIMEAHHDGHPIEPCARRIYDKICKAIEEQAQDYRDRHPSRAV